MNKYNFSSEWIHKQESLRHWMYYWHQVRILLAETSKDDTILEIGVGTRFTSNYLKSKGYQVTTIDIDKEKKPDIVANIVEYEFKEKYDHIIAFEVFEHLPFEDFTQILSKLRSVTAKSFILSLPRNEKVWLDLNMELPGSKEFRIKIASRRNKIISKHHYWEVDYKNYTNAFLKKEFAANGFDLASIEKIHSLFYYVAK
ncbi:class I SAM-dependent methyltransferase [Bacteroidota bacterium]